MNQLSPQNTIPPPASAQVLESVDPKLLGTSVNKAMAVAEFDLGGNILAANSNFLAMTGYAARELSNKRHADFCEPSYAGSNDYRGFWERLKRGAYEAGRFRMLGKSNAGLTVNALYCPVADELGETKKVVCWLQDVTEQARKDFDDAGKVAALDAAMITAQFDLEGVVLAANAVFCSTMGYRPDEIQGRNMRSFCDSRYTESGDYRNLWDKLRRGESCSGQYQVIGHEGREIWLQATYVALRNDSGRVSHVLFNAHDVTAEKRATVEAMGRVGAMYETQAVAEYKPDGSVLNANEKFSVVFGYLLEEIVGKHHRLLCPQKQAEAAAYRDFWKGLQRGETASGTYRRVGQNGREIWLQASYIPVRSDAGKVTKVIEIGTDVTEQTSQISAMRGKLEAIDRSQAVIEFDLDGTVLSANDNFCKVMLYKIDEVVGRHHRIFCDVATTDSIAYKQFWEKLNRGVFATGEYKRVAKDGTERWLNATYNPVRNADGQVVRIVKFASDITLEKHRAAEAQGKVDAISKSQAVIEFAPDGSILTANDNFLGLLGYTLEEIKGKHHRIFVDPRDSDKVEYRRFWDKLNRGEYDSGEYKRLGRGAKELWIRATYNPITDPDGKVVKIVKFAVDVTAQKRANVVYEGKVMAMYRSNMLVADYAADGRINNMNDNFLRALGLTLDEVKGRSIRDFCDHDFVAGGGFRTLWDSLERGEPQSGEYKFIGKGGDKVWLQGSFNPIADLDSKVTMVMGIAVDTTAQHNKLAEFTEQVTRLEETADGLAGAATGLTQTAEGMTQSAKRTSDEAVAASQALGEVASAVQTVAASTEEMVASIRDISRSANESAGMSKETSATTQETNEVVHELGVSSQEIGEVTEVISSIAQQTNLLALNATIEAARAGDAGKGFAVVANEVKELARQTAKATQDITQKIGAIQTNSQRAVKAIGAIAEAVNKLNSISGTIAAAVEQQTATTNEVSRVINAASENVRNISSNVEAVSAAADENNASASQTLTSSLGLSELAQRLQEIVVKVKST